MQNETKCEDERERERKRRGRVGKREVDPVCRHHAELPANPAINNRLQSNSCLVAVCSSSVSFRPLLHLPSPAEHVCV